MNHEIEAYEGELKELREKARRHLRECFKQLCTECMVSIDIALAEQEATMQKEIEAFTWHKLECGQCGVNADLLQRNDGKTMCRRCYNDHFEETKE